MIDFILANKDQLLGIVLVAAALGGLIVKLTPTKIDDGWYKKIASFLGINP